MHVLPSAILPCLPGIAWDAKRRRLFVTGKYWPRLFEVVPRAINPNTKQNQRLADTCIL
jgi:hypothetical protein